MSLLSILFNKNYEEDSYPETSQVIDYEEEKLNKYLNTMTDLYLNIDKLNNYQLKTLVNAFRKLILEALNPIRIFSLSQKDRKEMGINERKSTELITYDLLLGGHRK